MIHAAEDREVGRQPVGHELADGHPASQTVEPDLAQGTQSDAMA